MNQFKLGAYIQDQITYKGIIFNPGLRIDIMDPMNKYRILDPNAPNGLMFIPISYNSGFENTDLKYQISPRININYPLTERSFVSMSYGQFFESPKADYLYQYFNMEQMSTEAASSVIVGDPNMEAQLTNQYQIEYKNMITDEVAVSLSVYFKDIYNQLGIQLIQTTPAMYMQYAVSEYGSSKGIEVEVSKSLSNYFAFSLNYTLAWILVTATDESSNASVYMDPYSGKQTFPLSPYYSNNDVRHRIKGTFQFIMGKDEGPSLLGFKPLQNMFLSFEPTVRSGLPYTRTVYPGAQSMSERNIYRSPSY